jgi:hypothetical protein
MHRQAARIRRRDERMPAIASLLGYAVVLVLLNVVPGWEVVPFLTPAAEHAVSLANLALIVMLVSRAIALVEPSPRLRAATRYAVALICLALVADLWTTFPFDFGSEPESWASATRLVLSGLFVLALIAGMRSAAGIVRGRTAPRLSASHA